MTDNIKLIKFTSGEEIIADLKKDTGDGFVTIENAVRIVILPSHVTRQEKSTIVFDAFLSYVEEKEMKFDKRNILFIGTPIEILREQWKEVFGKNTILKMNNGPKLIMPS